jgi:acetylornithine deacetylase/succinyl-diaminopimelate desuccinylase-like protein
MHSPMRDVMEYIDAHGQRFVRELVEWVKIPSISSLPEHAPDVRKSAEHLMAELERTRPDRVLVLPTRGHPAVFAEWLHTPGRPTLLVYGHHDVQPVDPLEAWESPPFDPEARDGQLYGRGTVDDKGQVFIHAKAIEAFVETGARKLPVNLKLIVEGEEEIGSPNLADLLRDQAQMLASEYVCVSDTAMYGRGVPSLCVGLRGLVYFDIVVRGPATDVHSGSFGGGIANPANALASMLGALHDEEGRVSIPGFYDRVRALRPDEREAMAALALDEAAWLRASGAPLAVGEKGYSTLERIWARPTLDVCGLTSGFQGPGSKTIIPATAVAKLSCRLVPDQEPDEIARLLEAHVRRLAPPGVSVEIRYVSGGRPYLAPTDHPVFSAAKRAFSKAFGKETVFIREGGSIPFVRTIADSTGKPCLLMGFGQPDENSHAPNERLILENFHLGIKAAAYLYDEISRLDG